MMRPATSTAFEQLAEASRRFESEHKAAAVRVQQQLQQQMEAPLQALAEAHAEIGRAVVALIQHIAHRRPGARKVSPQHVLEVFRALAPAGGHRPPVAIPTDLILATVTRHYGVTQEDILRHGRNDAIMRPRHMAMVLARRLTLRTLPELGRVFERDGSTVRYAVDKMEDRADQDPALAAELAALEAEIRATVGAALS